jgi:RNA recognition motif-containing protein
MGRKLYVGNLPYSTGEQDLQELFGQAGSVESVSVMRDMATGRARGFRRRRVRRQRWRRWPAP